MAYDWSSFTGQLIEGMYELRRLSQLDGAGAEYIADREGRTYVVRVLPEDDASAEEQYRSWRTALSLEHANLARVYSAGRTRFDGIAVVYCLTDPVEDSLGDVIPERPLTPEEARDVLNSIVPALEFLHGQQIAHRAVEPSSIVAIEGTVKLTGTSVQPAEAPEIAADMHDLGATIVEFFTQKRPVTMNGSAAGLPAPFREIALGCMLPDESRRWDIRRVSDALAGRGASLRGREDVPVPAPVMTEAVRSMPTALPYDDDDEPVAPKRARVPMAVVLGLAVVVMLVVGYLALRRTTTAPVEPAEPPETAAAGPADRPSPMASPPAVLSPPVPKPTRSRVAETAATQNGNYAVVTASYNDFEAAERRAAAMEKRWPAFEPKVFPPEGEGRRYMVVLGTGMSKSEADQLLRKARSSGFPSDSYVTRITAEE